MTTLANTRKFPQATSALAPYEKHAFAFLGLWERDDWSLKAYGIHHQKHHIGTDLIDPPVLKAARVHALGNLHKAADLGHYNLGFVTLHQAAQNNFLLLQWWTDRNVLCEILSCSSAQEPENFQIVSSPVIACVYELVVFDFERRAWINTMLIEKSDRSAYLAARLPDGCY
jgi:hypothetical protein